MLTVEGSMLQLVTFSSVAPPPAMNSGTSGTSTSFKIGKVTSTEVGEQTTSRFSSGRLSAPIS